MKSLTNKNTFYIILLMFFLLFFASQWVNSRFWLNDFKVYYLAMKNFFNGESIYGVPFGLESGYYKYSPAALIPFGIFYFIPFKIAAIIYYSLVSFFIFFIFRNTYNIIAKLFKFEINLSYIVLLLSFLIVINHIYRELHLGNVNAFLLLIYV